MHILPQILAALSRKPDTCDDIDNLYEEIENNVASEYPNEGKHNIRKAITNALDVAQSLGIISIANQKIRIPFNCSGNQKRAPDIDAELNATNKKTRRKSASPRKRTPLTDDDPQYLIMMPRKNVAMDRMGRRRSARARRPRRGRTSSRGRVSHRRTSRRRR